MLKNYFKTAFRNFRRNKVHSIINLLSLCVGITCALFIFTYVKHELSYDRFFDHADQIYRLENISHLTGARTRTANINQYVIPSSFKPIPGIRKTTRFAPLSDIYIRANSKKIAESDFWVADSSFFNIFDFPGLRGNRKSLLTQPNSIVLSRQTAQKYFGDRQAVGKQLTLFSQKKQALVTITGIVSVPTNTHLQFKGVFSKDVIKTLYNTDLSQIYTAYDYLKLRKDAKPAEVARQLTQLNHKPGKHLINYRLRALPAIHLHSHARGEISPNGQLRNIYFLSAIALILLIVAAINFTSLATAQNLLRYKEAGIRKVLGANRGQLIRQFLFEAIGLSLLALAVGYFIIDLTLPYFNKLAGTTFEYSAFLNWTSVGIFVVLSIALGIIAGLYPALLLSSFQPVKTLKDISPSGKKGAVIWESIVVIQFSVTIAMIICTLTVFRQLQFTQNKDVGFTKNRIITISNPLAQNYKPLKARLESTAGVQNVSISSYVPGVSKTSGTALVTVPGRSDSLSFNWISVDYNYLQTYGIKLKEGRNLSKARATDSTKAFIINEAAAKTLGWRSPIGKRIDSFGKKGKIIGVTQDFNLLSLYQNVPPVIFLINQNLYFQFSVKVAPSADIPHTIKRLKKSWASLVPNIPFQYKFVDQQFDALYKSDKKMGQVFGVFAALALIISCLGLFSLSSFIAARKRKEVGIRKVLGASIMDILYSFYKNYGKLIAVACVVAVPVSYLFIKNWLQNFAFHIAMPVGLFLLAIIAVLLVAGLAVTYESLKASLTNPVDSIRS